MEWLDFDLLRGKSVTMNKQVSITDLQDLWFYPFLPNTELFESLRRAASEKWPSRAGNLGFIGHDGKHAHFRIHLGSEKFRLELEEIRRGARKLADRTH